LHIASGMTAYMCDAHVPCTIDQTDLGDVVQMLKAEYLEMPGLRLTLAQAQRLWNLDRDACAAVLNGLVKSGFLCCTEVGVYGRTAMDPRSESLDREHG
jgi:hypothetical protein